MTGPLDLQTHLRNIIAPSLAVGSRFSIGNVSTDTPKATVRFERTLALWMEGLNCPFMKNPTEYTIGVRNVSRLFLNEVRHIQPKGPCYIGGWSAGGVRAYEVTLQLMAMDEKVSKLFLIDSPCPVALKPLPTRLFRFFDDAGLLGSRGKGSSPSWLIPHFEYSVQNLAEYEHSPIPSGSAPQTIAIWAKEGVCENMNGFELPRADEDEPKTMKWLLDKRTDFGDNGWAQLLGQNAISCKVMGGNHFTMMTNDNAIILGEFLKTRHGIY